MSNSNIVIRLENVSKTFKIRDRATYSIRNKLTTLFSPTRPRIIHALNNINLKISKGEFFGIIGRNGSGKSTLLKIMSGVYQPDKGSMVAIEGSFQKLALGTGFDMELTARENIYLNGSLFGLSFKKIGNIFHDIIQFAELGEFIDTKLKFFSTGMVSRLGFSIAIHVDADILFLDEFGGVGDAWFREKSQRVFTDFIIKGKTIVHVSHDLEFLKKYCDRMLLIDNGCQIVIGKPNCVLDQYRKL